MTYYVISFILNIYIYYQHDYTYEHMSSIKIFLLFAFLFWPLLHFISLLIRKIIFCYREEAFLKWYVSVVKHVGYAIGIRYCYWESKSEKTQDPHWNGNERNGKAAWLAWKTLTVLCSYGSKEPMSSMRYIFSLIITGNSWELGL